MIIAFTGHRPDKLGGYQTPNPTYESVIAAIDGVLTREYAAAGLFSGLVNGINTELKVISGMALGVDQWAAETCITKGIPFIAAIPFVGQESKWPESSQIKYNYLMTKAAQVVVVSEGGYAAWKMQKRNEYMVNHCDKLLAVWDGSDGGTANCVKYALRIGKPYEVIWNRMTETSTGD